MKKIFSLLICIMLFSGFVYVPPGTGATLILNSVGYEVDVLMAYGGGVNYNSATIKRALDTIGPTNQRCLVLRPGTWTISAALTFTSNITLKVISGALLTKATGGSLAINGPFEAGLYQVFSGFDTGITFGLNTIEAYSQWWQTNTIPGTTDMTVAVNAAVLAVPFQGIVVINGNQAVTTVSLKSDMTLRIDGTLTNISNIALETTNGVPDGVSTHPTIYVNTINNVHIKGTGTIFTPKYEGIKINVGTKVSIEGIKIVGVRTNRAAYDGIHVVGSAETTIDGVDISNIGGIREFYGDLIWMVETGVSGDAITIISSTDTIVRHSKLYNIAAHGLYWWDSIGLDFSHNKIHDVGINGIFVNKPTYVTTPMSYLIDDNDIYSCGADGIDNIGAGGASYQIASGIISNNRISYIGVLPNNAGNVDGAVITAAYSLNDIIVSNNIINTATRMAYYISGAKSIIFSNNKVANTLTLATFAGGSDDITISGGIANVTGNLITLGDSGTVSDLTVSHITGSATGYLISPVSPIVLTNLNLNHLNISQMSAQAITNTGGGKITNCTLDSDITLSDTGMIFDSNNLSGNLLVQDFANGSVSNNFIMKQLEVIRTTYSRLNNNHINTSKGNYYFYIHSVLSVCNKLAVLGNVAYKNSGGVSLTSDATNSVFANICEGTSNITGAGTVVLY